MLLHIRKNHTTALIYIYYTSILTQFLQHNSHNQTMKQKVVIKVSMNCQKSRSKALKIVVGASGVESAALKGDDKTQIEVTGEGLDAAVLTQLLRKKVGFADLVSVGPAGGGGDNKKDDKKENEAKFQVAWPTYYNSTGHYYDAVPVFNDPYHYHNPNNCSIM